MSQCWLTCPCLRENHCNVSDVKSALDVHEDRGRAPSLPNVSDDVRTFYVREPTVCTRRSLAARSVDVSPSNVPKLLFYKQAGRRGRSDLDSASQQPSASAPRNRPFRSFLPISAAMPKRRPPPADGYNSPLGEKRGELRKVLGDEIRVLNTYLSSLNLALTVARIGRLSGSPHAEMYWTAREFFSFVVRRHRLLLEGWPEDVLFANPSDIRGGIRTFRRLLDRWNQGILRFRTVSESELHELDEARAAPGRYVEAPRCLVGRPDIKKHRRRPVTNPLGLPRPKEKKGPKSPEFVLDSDAEPDALTRELQMHAERRERRRKRPKIVRPQPKSKEFVEDSDDERQGGEANNSGAGGVTMQMIV